MELMEMHCTPLSESDKPLNKQQINEYMNQLPPEWQVHDDKILKKEFPFEDFKRGMAFAQEIGILAEEEQHHPAVCVEFKKVTVELSTHDIGGLSLNDFIMAAKTEEI